MAICYVLSLPPGSLLVLPSFHLQLVCVSSMDEKFIFFNDLYIIQRLRIVFELFWGSDWPVLPVFTVVSQEKGEKYQMGKKTRNEGALTFGPVEDDDYTPGLLF